MPTLRLWRRNAQGRYAELPGSLCATNLQDEGALCNPLASGLSSLFIRMQMDIAIAIHASTHVNGANLMQV